MSGQQTPPTLRSSGPFRPRRLSTTPSQRPKTSSGEIEPRSDFLRDALREKKGLPLRSQSTTPRRARVGLKNTVSQNPHDEWMPSDEESNVFRPSTNRPQKTRRASDLGTAKSALSPNAMLGQKETAKKLDKLQKDNFDLKLKITMQQERMNQLHEELEQAVSSAQELNNAVVFLSKNIASTEEELDKTRASNQEMAEMNDELVKELEQRDEGIKLRQLAIEEAAGIIQTLEMKCEKLEQASTRPDASPRPGSDYFSGDADGTPPTKRSGSLRPPVNPTHLGVLPTPPDSDYFSADTSPNMTPRTPRFAPTDRAAQMIRAQEKGAQFNKEIGLRSTASKDSLLSSFIDTPSLPPAPARLLRRKTPTPGVQPRPKAPLQRSMTTMEASRQDTPPWSPDSRQLRTLFAQGEFNRRIHASTPLRHTNTTPSVTVGSASTSTEELFKASESSRPTTAVSDPTATPCQKAQPIFRNTTPLPSQQQQQQQIVPARTPVNYNNWPRKYPEWPPSAGLGLRDRDILFHGEGMGEMFPVSTPKVGTTQHPSTISHLRSSSVTPMDALGLPPKSGSISVGATTPQSAPGGLMKKAFSHRLSASLSGGRPTGLERRKTTLR
jgi:hypothetical protein